MGALKKKTKSLLVINRHCSSTTKAEKSIKKSENLKCFEMFNSIPFNPHIESLISILKDQYKTEAEKNYLIQKYFVSGNFFDESKGPVNIFEGGSFYSAFDRFIKKYLEKESGGFSAYRRLFLQRNYASNLTPYLPKDELGIKKSFVILLCALQDAILTDSLELSKCSLNVGSTIFEMVHNIKRLEMTIENSILAREIGTFIITLGADSLPHIFSIRKEAYWRATLIEFSEYFYKEVHSLGTPVFKEYPMLIEPFPWLPTELTRDQHGTSRVKYSGGFEHNLYNKGRLVKGKKWVNLDLASNNIIQSNINSLQEVKWRVNKRVLNLYKELLFLEEPFGNGFVNRAELGLYFEEGEKYVTEDLLKQIKENFSEIFTKPKFDPFIFYKKFRKNKFSVDFYYVQLLEAFSHVEGFYFVHNIDGRGRIYPAGVLTYQSSELVRAGLEFAEGVVTPLTEKNLLSLAEYGFSLYGKDNCISAEDFIKKTAKYWVEDYDFVFLSKAKKPLLFLAFCEEYKRWLNCKKMGLAFIKSHLPIYIDASCNALQHYSALGGITDFLHMLNMRTTVDSSDLYTYIVDKVKSEVVCNLQTKLEAETKAHHKKILQSFLNNKDLFLTRKVLKTPIMSFGYGVSAFGIAEQILDQIKEDPRLAPFLYLVKEPLTFLVISGPLFTAIKKELLPFEKVFSFLRSIVSCYKRTEDSKKDKESKEVVPFKWSLPSSGVTVSLLYKKEKSLNFFFTLKGVTKSFRVKKVLEEVDFSRMIQSFPPNFVHSLDALNLHLFLKEYFPKGEKAPIAVIHDSIGVPLIYLAQSKLKFKKAFIFIYQEQINEILEDMIKNNCSPIRRRYFLNEANLFFNQRKQICWKEVFDNKNFIKY